MDTPVPTAFNNEWTDGRGAAALCRQERGACGGDASFPLELGAEPAVRWMESSPAGCLQVP